MNQYQYWCHRLKYVSIFATVAARIPTYVVAGSRNNEREGLCLATAYKAVGWTRPKILHKIKVTIHTGSPTPRK